MPPILLSAYHNVLKCSCFMFRWKAGTNFPLLLLVSVCSLESAKPSSFQQRWLIQFPCIFFPMYELYHQCTEGQLTKAKSINSEFPFFFFILHLNDKIDVDASLYSHIECAFWELHRTWRLLLSDTKSSIERLYWK